MTDTPKVVSNTLTLLSEDNHPDTKSLKFVKMTDDGDGSLMIHRGKTKASRYTSKGKNPTTYERHTGALPNLEDPDSPIPFVKWYEVPTTDTKVGSGAENPHVDPIAKGDVPEKVDWASGRNSTKHLSVDNYPLPNFIATLGKAGFSTPEIFAVLESQAPNLVEYDEEQKDAFCKGWTGDAALLDAGRGPNKYISDRRWRGLKNKFKLANVTEEDMAVYEEIRAGHAEKVAAIKVAKEAAKAAKEKAKEKAKKEAAKVAAAAEEEEVAEVEADEADES